MTKNPPFTQKKPEQMLPDKWHVVLHRLWSKATCNPDYVKAEWMELESILHQCAARLNEGAEDDSP